MQEMHLIYAIIRRKSSFDRLFNLKLNEENEENEKTNYIIIIIIN